MMFQLHTVVVVTFLHLLYLLQPMVRIQKTRKEERWNHPRTSLETSVWKSMAKKKTKLLENCGCCKRNKHFWKSAIAKQLKTHGGGCVNFLKKMANQLKTKKLARQKRRLHKRT